MEIHRALRSLAPRGGSGPTHETSSGPCEGTALPTVGELRYNSTVDYERFGKLGLGRTSPAHTVTVTSTEGPRGAQKSAQDTSSTPESLYVPEGGTIAAIFSRLRPPPCGGS